MAHPVQARPGSTTAWTITSLMNTEVATANFVEQGEMIAEENSEAKPDILTIVGDIRGHGHALVLSAREFALDPCSTA